jgi:ubiquitin conjugation factor E4 A
VFAKHPCASYLTEALLNVFVSIEMTGQSVQFEQKFNYRRPMYELLEFLWNMPVAYSSGTSSSYGVDNKFDKKLLNQHRVKIGQLANEVFDNLSSSEQTLFLKFLNFLINDANFLLLEGKFIKILVETREKNTNIGENPHQLYRFKIL